MQTKRSLRLTSSKRAVENISWTTVIELTLVLILIIVSGVYALSKFGGALFLSREVKATRDNFERLTMKIKEMLDDPRPFVYERNFPIYIKQYYSIVAYDPYIAPHDYVVDAFNDKRYIPTQCNEPTPAPCICLYKEGWSKKPDKRDKSIVSCQRFDGKNILFYAISTPYVKGISSVTGAKRSEISTIPFMGSSVEPEYVVMCGYISFRIPGVVDVSVTRFQTQNLYLEKYESGDKTYFMITEESDETLQRYVRFENEMRNKALNSEDICGEKSSSLPEFERKCNGQAKGAIVDVPTSDCESGKAECVPSGGFCNVECIPKCKLNSPITTQCVCGGLVASSEFCNQDDELVYPPDNSEAEGINAE